MAQEKSSEMRKGGGGKTVAVDTMDPQTEEHHMIPVWFFVGVLLLIYGILIFIQGISEWSNPPNTVLSSLHPTFWWGILLIVLGSLFSWAHFPGKKN
jgi:FtsH-binding integral membrane protein